ncbi:hypothetical protein M409DRAFT_54520 [Zasmidium cellare ATCC 36951]|uniref:SUZ domain-containing protein n=1 Tax=Zasmidium cellare ATCC 36951 TaxID=1080233 RepID=A0A6A6CLW8_ZASCE|nr:uncharacterized protein M409DRAFT_54520 [Zasmidium cellare ATCC 36951]KAF2166729.1 hypothetical protein M409DRAFT_54520 [Zasmidium cellare ATCC 36951]
MASAPAASSADAKKDKPSFAKVFRPRDATTFQGSRLTWVQIAAAGIKPPNVQQNPPTSSPNTNQKHEVLPSPPQDGAPIVAPSNGPSQTAGGPRHKKLVQLASNDMKHTKEPVEMGPNGPEVRVQIVESVPQRPREPAPEGSLMPSSDDVGTQVSSSSGSNKPQSLDGKSDVASGTTFALDEKDSLRPDDSASVKAVDEEDMFSPPGSGLPGSRIGSDDGVRAFRDQLREISSMEPQRRGPPPIFGHAPKGVLYVPPQGPGIGSVPSAHQAGPPPPEPVVDCAPDQKLLDALENPRDRVWVLKLEQDVIDFVKDPKESSLTLPQCHAFYRLLAHKMADYYMLGHLVDDTSAAVRLYKTPDCRIPPPLTGITQPSTAASTPPPSAQPMKILKRGADRPAIANGSNMQSKSGSENGDSGDEKKKGPITREEREARYEAARLRIMGSAKPTESPETSKDKQESRPSSTTGKKNKKKARADSDDGFDPRSAYSNFYTPTYGSDGVTTPSYGYQGYSESGNNPFPSAYAPQGGTGSMQQMQLQQSSSNPNWNQQSYQQVDPTQAWAQGQSSGYDLSADFQRSMTFQNQMPAQSPSVGYNANYGPQYNYGGQQQGWSQQQQQQPPPQYQIQPIVSQAGYGYGLTYTPTTSQSPHDQPYAFGQLPSQAFPGRPPSKSEHPLPGSYKSKHFNPQSQTFIPGQTNGGSPFSPHAVPAGFHQGYGGQLPQRQNSAQSQGSAFGSPHHHNSPNMMQNRTHSTPLTHPLPQPVFPRQPSPNVPLPPKPGTAPHRANEYAPIPPPATTIPPQQHSQSLLAKWGAPASLPAKPPPSAEPFDAVKLKQIQQQSFVSPAATARHPPGLPAFGTMPQNGGSQIVNGSKRG